MTLFQLNSNSCDRSKQRNFSDLQVTASGLEARMSPTQQNNSLVVVTDNNFLL